MTIELNGFDELGKHFAALARDVEQNGARAEFLRDAGIEVPCPGCGTLVPATIGDVNHGRTVQCPGCGDGIKLHNAGEG